MTREHQSSVSGEITSLLARVESGGEAVDLLFPLIYEELRALARVHFSQERVEHTLQPTAVVHEAFARMVGQTQVSYRDRQHFLSVAAIAIRRVLVDHARSKARLKRAPVRGLGEGVEKPVAQIDLLALDEALLKLEESEPRMARAVELRFFGGLSFNDIGEILEVSSKTARRDWIAARGWLKQRLGDADV